MGMFDSVKIECPLCGEEVLFQSKSGPCMLVTYDQGKVPIAVAQSVVGQVEVCKCGEKLTAKLYAPIPKTVGMYGDYED